jgi:hypothetical protein
MANNRELSQFGSFISVDDNSRNIGIATTATPSVGIGTTNPQYKLDVHGDINSTTDIKIKGVGVSTGIVVQNNGAFVGVAETINFSTNVTASSSSAGTITVTASGGGGGGGGGGLTEDEVVALIIALG